MLDKMLEHYVQHLQYETHRSFVEKAAYLSHMLVKHLINFWINTLDNVKLELPKGIINV